MTGPAESSQCCDFIILLSVRLELPIVLLKYKMDKLSFTHMADFIEQMSLQRVIAPKRDVSQNSTLVF